MSLSALFATHKLIICVGSGGVGKTTTAAAIGLQAAKEGRRVLVLTIDPARRRTQARIAAVWQRRDADRVG